MTRLECSVLPLHGLLSPRQQMTWKLLIAH